MFKKAKVGEKVWDFAYGWGEIVEMDRSLIFGLTVKFKYSKISFLFGGMIQADTSQTLFYNEIKFEIPKKPLPDLKVDTKVIVWNDVSAKKKRYFSHFNNVGKIACFHNGTTSWSNKGISDWWENWELAEQGENND